METRTLAPPIRSTLPDRVGRLDEAAFARFYERTSRGVWAYAYRVMGQAADADDVVQEAYVRLLSVNLPEADDERRKYLYRVVSNLIVDRWRRRGREATGGEAEEIASPPIASDPDVAKTFASLTRRDRALLWLAYVEEESHAEIAQSLGVGTRSVKVLLFRAKRRLRSLLTARGLKRT